MMQSLIDFVLLHLDYWCVFVFMIIESSFVPFPSEVIVPPAAFLSMLPDNSMHIVLVVVVATLGADVGALVNYMLAKWLGRPIVYKFADSRLGHILLIDRAKVEHAEAYFREHGAASTFFGRLIPAVRQLISIPAGLANMPLRPFLLYTTLGAGLWNSVLGLLGYLIYIAYPASSTAEVAALAGQYSHEIGYAILAIVAVVIGVIIYKGCKKG